MSRKNLEGEFALDENNLCQDGWSMTSRETLGFAAWILAGLAGPAAARRLDVVLLLGGLGRLSWRLKPQ